MEDFQSDTAKVQLQVLGLIGKLLTGPWMKMFYTSAGNEIHHIDGIAIVKKVIQTLKEKMENPVDLMSSNKDLLGNDLVRPFDETLVELRKPPHDVTLFSAMMKGCFLAIVDVLERQYAKYFSLDITEKLREETMSARSHNIDAEEVMGMFSAAQKKSPNATLCFLSCKMRAQKNRTIEYIDSLEKEERERIVKKAMVLGRKQRDRRRQKQKDLRVELCRRQEVKRQIRDTAERKKLERNLKNNDLDAVLEMFPSITVTSEKREKLVDIMEGRIVGRKMCHVWSDDEGLVVYNGKIEKLKAKSKIYRVAYWSKSEDYDDATDYDMSMFALAADFLHDDLIFE